MEVKILSSDPERIPEVAEWLHMVEDGKIAACKEQHLLCAFVRRVFAVERLWLDRKRLDTYLAYQQFFPFDLDPIEKFMLALVLCLYSPPGVPRTVATSIPSDSILLPLYITSLTQ